MRRIFETILFKKIYDENTIFAAPFQIDFQTIGMKVQIAKKDYFYSINLKTKQEQLFDFGVNFSGLKKLFISSSALQTNYMYAFEYLSQNDISRLGCVIFNKDAKPEQILLQTQDFEGGIHNPFIFRNNFFYSTMDENDFKVFSVPLLSLNLITGSPDMIVPAAEDAVRSVSSLFPFCCHTILASLP